MTTVQLTAAPAWTRAQRLTLSGVVAVVVLLHVPGRSTYLAATEGPTGAGVLAYTLGIRHPFDADHIAAIDDTAAAPQLEQWRHVGGAGPPLNSRSAMRSFCHGRERTRRAS